MAKDNVFRTSELMDSIFSYTDSVSIGRSTQVCKVWSKFAIKSLWCHMEDVRDLFSVLAPFDTSSYRLKFSRNLNDDDWDIFSKYAPYVKSLVLSGRRSDLVALYQEVSRTRPMVVLLPNLRDLKIDCDGGGVSCLYSTMFLHENLQEISIFGQSSRELGDLCKTILRRSPNITKLSMGAYWSTSSISGRLAPFLKQLSSLRQICFNKFILTDNLFSALSGLQHLEKILMFPISTATGDTSNLDNFHPIIQAGAFPKLRVLEIATTLGDAIDFFSGPFNSSVITDLRLSLDCHESGEEYKKLFECISTHCPSLVSLDMTSEWWDDASDDMDALTIDLFRPLFKLTGVERFAFSHPLPVALADDGLADMARNWIKLKDLSFNRDFYKVSCYIPGIAVLQHFALHCPDLESLEFCLDASDASFPEVPLAQFRSLKSLRIGCSPIDDKQAVAIYLAQLCSDCDVLLEYDCIDEIEGKKWREVWMMVEMAVKTMRLDRIRLSRTQTPLLIH